MKLFRFIHISLFIVLLATTAMAEGVRDLTPGEAADAIAETSTLVILDIRTPDEFQAGHIKSARNIDFYGKDFRKRLDEQDKGAPCLVYCRSGRRSGIALEYMQQTGFETIFHLKNGINAWKAASLPLVH